MTSMTSNQPYLLRAFYEWIVDNDLTPYIVVDATNDMVEVPLEFVKDGQIVLNVSPSACVNFSLDLTGLSFQARFGGQPRRLSMPSEAIMAIYARENGAGTVFATEEEMAKTSKPSEPQATGPASIEDVDASDNTDAPVPPKKGKPTLKVIK
ncbi:stringent starvation protein B [Alteromonas sp. 76-1]|jgi:stringent starvation protein B|uniref:ClpXP protease specificity-enhancing factor n=1 Tax=Alteromonas TaxID=226 RepID=UPI000FD1874D|nr:MULTISPECIES: ClpXP protease specificity-enhancing factor [Alteromonas]MCQ8850011.1 ClpXP protease specificity-enhancing factor [Alteromonas stellipolaris]VEL95777.1 stringent starvation protein B [Alteromonas sp. 76-1]|tara:strand:+ start:10000 stop:10455 length:456 start_codon:yes stop_codon:yes gene_type:complete